MNLRQLCLYCSKTYSYIGTYMAHLRRDHKERRVYVSAEQLPDDGFAIEHDSIRLPIVHEPHHDAFFHPSDDDSSDTEADSKNACIDPEQPPVWTRICGTPHLDNRLAGKHISNEYFNFFNDEIDLWSPFSCDEEYRLTALVRQAQLAQSCYQRAFQEPYDGNRQQLDFVPHFIQTVERNVLRNGHRLLEIRGSVLQSFGRFKHPSRRWLHPFLLPQSCWMHWVPHATACVQGTYVVCTSKRIQWCWGTYLLRGEIKWLVVEWTGTLVEFRHSYNDFDRFISNGGRLELRLFLCSAAQTRHILQTIRATRRNGQYIWVSGTSTRRLDQSLQILQASLLPFCPFLRNITFKDMEEQLLWRNNKSTIERF